MDGLIDATHLANMSFQLLLSLDSRHNECHRNTLFQPLVPAVTFSSHVLIKEVTERPISFLM